MHGCTMMQSNNRSNLQVSGGIFGARSMDGTSASTPAFASIISLLNEARDQAGKPPLGFLNPFLYANAAAFTDIVAGNNKHGRGGTSYPYGWECTQGWDPVTGACRVWLRGCVRACMLKHVVCCYMCAWCVRVRVCAWCAWCVYACSLFKRTLALTR